MSVLIQDLMLQRVDSHRISCRLFCCFQTLYPSLNLALIFVFNSGFFLSAKWDDSARAWALLGDYV